MLDMHGGAKEESTTTNAHKARHVQCKLQAGIVCHIIFMTKVLQEAISNLQCININGYKPQHHKQIFYSIKPMLSLLQHREYSHWCVHNEGIDNITSKGRWC